MWRLLVVNHMSISLHPPCWRTGECCPNSCAAQMHQRVAYNHTPLYGPWASTSRRSDTLFARTERNGGHMDPNDRPRHLRRPSHRNQGGGDTSAWKIAGGVFLGLSLFYAAYRAHVAMEQRAAIEQFNRAMAELARPDADPMGWKAAARKIEKERAAARELHLGQRCIDGQRFERVENGWRQVKAPC